MAKQSSSRPTLATRHNGLQTESKPAPLLAEYSALRYDYAKISNKHRRAVQDAAVDINRKQRRAREDMLAVGRRFIEVKELLPFGQFLDWLEAEFELSDRMARHQMEVSHAFADSELWKRVSKLSDGAIYALAAPSTPQSAREEVARMIDESDKVPTRIEVERLIKRHVMALAAPPPTPAPRMIVMQATTLIVTDEPTDPAPTAEELAAIAQVEQEREEEDAERAERDSWRASYERVPDAVPIAFLEGAEYAEATRHLAAPEPTMPADLAAAGYRLTINSRGLCRWVLDKSWGGFQGNWTDDPAEAIEEARADIGERAAVVPAPEPAAIEADYIVIGSEQPKPHAVTVGEWAAHVPFDAWLAAAPTEPDLRECLAILELAKAAAQRARTLQPSLYNHVTNALPSLSQLIIAVERQLKHEQAQE